MENSTVTTPPTSTGIQRQREYLARQAASGADDSLIVGRAFVNGIRDLGYRSTATALDELIDNAVQAAATTVHLAFGFEGGSDKKPSAIAVIDDGHGMIPEMLAYSVKWGGTDRENDRRGLGRYGYGLPSSSVSQGERFRVYSRVDGGDLYGVTVDLEEIREGKHTATGGRIKAPSPEIVTLPWWLQAYIDEHFDGLPHGSIVLLDKFDRLTWKTRDALRKNLLEHIGVIYRNFLRNTTVVVDGAKVEAIDPLFLTPAARYYDLDADRAESLDDIVIDVKSDDGKTVKGQIKIRIAYLSPTFPYIDKSLRTEKRNKRMSVLGAHEGIIVMRNGRQMDVLNRADWGKGLSFRNVDRYWQVEIDFPPILDEEFSVTTSKQGVRLSERIWELLRQADLDKTIRDLQVRHDEEGDRIRRAAETDKDAQRPAEIAVDNAEKFFATETQPEDPVQKAKADEAFESEVQRRALETGVPPQQVREALHLEIQQRPTALIHKSEPGNVFYRPERLGTQRRVYLNTAHPFYKELYASPTSTPEVRRALEVLVLVLAAGEFEARDERLEFYENERAWWSQRLKTSLRELAKVVPPTETRAERLEVEIEDTEGAPAEMAGAV
jgi:hypothetical protein